MFQVKNFQFISAFIALICLLVVLFVVKFAESKSIVLILCNTIIVLLFLAFLFYENKRKHLDKRKENFIATLTHDLKTPALAQLRVIDLLLKGKFGVLNDEQREIIKHMKNSCEYMKNLIFTILDTYLLENGDIKLSLEKFDLLNLVAMVKNELNCLALEKNQQININPALSKKFIYADKLQIKRVITNLISNAVFHGKSNFPLNIYLENDDDAFYFRVENQAEFISESDIGEMFEKYKTSSGKFKKTGNGLGLYLSKGIIENHKGQISAELSSDGICKVGFSIPLKQELSVY